MKPLTKPDDPRFGSGPTAKRPGWDINCLRHAELGRSHRAAVAQAQLREVIDRSRQILGIPSDFRLGIVPASDTGAFEMAMWSMLGARGVDVLEWESFSKGWVTDIVKQLQLDDVRRFDADYGQLPDLQATDSTRDIVFVWNGTTSGVCVPDGSWIADDRSGLTLCDATSAAFAMEMPWDKLDVVTWSWQKVLGGEAQHGMLALSPRAVERLQTFQPARPLPKIFRLTQSGSLIEGIFKGQTINTPSMLAVADVLDALRWAEEIGGLEQLIARSKGNLEIVSQWVAVTDWIDFLAGDANTRSSTSICLKLVDPSVTVLDAAGQRSFVKNMTSLLAEEAVAYDIEAYRDAPPGLRIWGGATVEAENIRLLLAWLDWAFVETKSRFA